MRGRKPIPTHWKVINGNPGRRPLNENEPKPEAALPNPPPHLDEDGIAEWDRVAPRLFNLGLLTDLDRGPLAAYCDAYSTWCKASRALAAMADQDPHTKALFVRTSNGNAIQNPLLGTLNHARAEMMRFAAEFGMTPSARTRIDASFGAAPPATQPEGGEKQPSNWF